MILHRIPEPIEPCDLIMGAEGHVYNNIRPAELPVDSEKIILLVHGYNAGQADVGRSLGVFKQLINDVNPALLTSVLTSSWPGCLTLQVLDYRRALGNALRCAQHLVKQVRYWYDTPSERRPPPHLIIVAHSMGCRLVLEALQYLQQEYPNSSGRPPLLKRLDLLLMAAAIPEAMVRPGARLQPTTSVTSVHALHSKVDMVLGVAFPIAQAFSGEGWQGEAVGFRGKPLTGKPDHDMTMHLYSHVAYWRRQETVQTMGRLFGLAMTSGTARPLSQAPLAQTELPQAPLLTLD